MGGNGMDAQGLRQGDYGFGTVRGARPTPQQVAREHAQAAEQRRLRQQQHTQQQQMVYQQGYGTGGMGMVRVSRFVLAGRHPLYYAPFSHSLPCPALPFTLGAT